MKIGVFGGSFDPVHIGHEALVKHVLQKYSLDKILIVPVYVSPFKVKTPPEALPKDRVAMLKLAFTGDSRIEICTDEIDRKEVSYTINTVRRMVQKFPHDEIVLILTDEALPTFDLWEESEEIQRLVQVVFTGPRGSINSTEIRNRLKRGGGCKEFLSAKVLGYIEKYHLYLSGIEKH